MTAPTPSRPTPAGGPGTPADGYRCVTSACPMCSGSGVVTRAVEDGCTCEEIYCPVHDGPGQWM